MSEADNLQTGTGIESSTAYTKQEQSRELFSKAERILEGAVIMGLDEGMIDDYTADVSALRQTFTEVSQNENIDEETLNGVINELTDILQLVGEDIEEGLDDVSARDLLNSTLDLYEESNRTIDDSRLGPEQKDIFRKQLEEFDDELDTLIKIADADLEKSFCVIINRKINDHQDSINDAVIQLGHDEVDRQITEAENTLIHLEALHSRLPAVEKVRSVLTDDLTLLHQFSGEHSQLLDFINEEGVYPFLQHRKHIETPWINTQIRKASEAESSESTSITPFARQEPFEIVALAHLSSELNILLLTKNFIAEVNAVNKLSNEIKSLADQTKEVLSGDQKASWVKQRRECQVAYQSLASKLENAPPPTTNMNGADQAVLKNEESMISLQLDLIESHFLSTLDDEATYIATLAEQKKFQWHMAAIKGLPEAEIRALPKIKEIEAKEQRFNKARDQYIGLDAISPDKTVARKIAILAAQTTGRSEMSALNQEVQAVGMKLGITKAEQAVNLSLVQLNNLAEYRASTFGLPNPSVEQSQAFLFARLQKESQAIGVKITDAIMNDLVRVHLQHRFVTNELGIQGEHVSIMPPDADKLKKWIEERANKLLSKKTLGFAEDVSLVDTFEGGGVSEKMKPDGLDKDDRRKKDYGLTKSNPLALDFKKVAARNWNLEYEPQKVIRELEEQLTQEHKDLVEARNKLATIETIPIRAFNDGTAITEAELQRRVSSINNGAGNVHDALQSLFNEPDLHNRTFVIPYVDIYEQNATSLPRDALDKKIAYRAKALLNLNKSSEIVASTPVTLSYDQIIQVSQGQPVSNVIGNPALNDIPQSTVDKLKNKDGSLFCRMAPDTPIRIEMDKVVDIDRNGPTNALYYRMSKQLVVRVPLSRISASGHNIDHIEKEFKRRKADHTNQKLLTRIPLFRSFNVYGVDEIERQKAKFNQHSKRRK